MKRSSLFPLGICLYMIAFAPPADAQNPVTKTAQKVVKATKKAVKRATTKTKALANSASASVKSTLANIPSPGWEKLQKAYAYNNAPPQVKETPKENANALEIRLSFAGANGKPVSGTFMRPKADGVYPVALVLHGLTNNKEIAIAMFGKSLVAKGVAILALDAPEHGAQRKAGKNMWTKQVLVTAVHEGTRNYRKALDYLATRQDVDSSRIGLIGYSMGSIMGSILGGVDTRVTAFSLCVGGDPVLPLAKATLAKQRDSVYSACPSLYISHIAGRPILMQNGKTDVIVVAPAAYLLHNEAKAPKEIVWFNGGHDMNAAVKAKAVDWLVAKLIVGEAPKEDPKPEADPKQKEAPKPDTPKPE